jgi:hypothetical protein
MGCPVRADPRNGLSWGESSPFGGSKLEDGHRPIFFLFFRYFENPVRGLRGPPISGLRCSPYFRTVALLEPDLGALATIFRDTGPLKVKRFVVARFD